MGMFETVTCDMDIPLPNELAGTDLRGKAWLQSYSGGRVMGEIHITADGEVHCSDCELDGEPLTFWTNYRGWWFEWEAKRDADTNRVHAIALTNADPPVSTGSPPTPPDKPSAAAAID